MIREMDQLSAKNSSLRTLRNWLKKACSTDAYFTWNLWHLWKKKNFSIQDETHLSWSVFLIWWPTLSSQYVTDKMFSDLKPEVLLVGVFDVRNCYLFVLKRHIFLGPYPSVFLLFAWYMCTHSLQYYFFHHSAFLPFFLPFLLAFWIAVYHLHSNMLMGHVVHRT